MLRVTRPVAALALVVSATMLTACGGDDNGGGDGGSATPSTATSGSGAALPTVKLEASDFKFSPNPLTFTKGKAVTISLHNSGNSIHNFQSLDFKLDRDVAAGKTVTFTFTPIAAGTFEYVCKYHTAQGMKGNIVIS
ncbi:MAG: cupredoxin domain-containing protein [Mycobacteriales bacterium]|nr:cupredoxin domain-containing protein [Frankia sp.]